MTRPELIHDLRQRYAQAVAANKRKQAAILYARLCALMTRQVKYENRKARRLAA